MATESDLVLKFNAETLRQRDVEKFVGIVAKSKLGNSPVEYAGKVVRAAVEAGWIVAPKLSVEDIPDLEPWRVAQYAQQIDQLYSAALTVPADGAAGDNNA